MSECQGSFVISGALSPASEKPNLTLDLAKKFPTRPVDSRRCGANSDICIMQGRNEGVELTRGAASTIRDYVSSLFHLE